MKLLVVSHPCVVAVNQQQYAAVEQATGWDLTIVTPDKWKDEYGNERVSERWPSFRGRLLPTPVRRSGNIVLHTYRTSFRKLINEVDPDAVYVHHEPYAAATAQVYWGNAMARGRSSRRPIGFYSAQNLVKKYPPPFRWTESWVMRTSRFAFPCSESVADVCRGKGFSGTTSVLPLAIDPAAYYPHPGGKTVRSQWLGENADPGTVLLGYLGRLVPQKGLATLLAALGQLKDLPWRIALVGSGPMEDELKQLAAAEGVADRLTFVGFVPHADAPRYLSAMDVLVLPSETQPGWKEQFGRVVLEAIACGAAVVGSDSGEIPVLIRNTGGGMIFKERDPADLAAALKGVIVDKPLRERLAEAGRAALADRYTVADAASLFARSVEQAVRSATDHGADVATTIAGSTCR